MLQPSKNTVVDIDKDSNYLKPSSIFNEENLTVLQEFYQYRTANEKDSPLSLKIDTILSDSEKDDLWNKLLLSAKVDDSKFIFSSLLRNKISDIQNLELSDTTLKCDGIKGFVHINNPPKDPIKSGPAQHKIDTLFKRIRNAFAHGRIAQKDGYIIFEDKLKQMTARIVLTDDVLKNWKNEIEQFLDRREQTNVKANQ